MFGKIAYVLALMLATSATSVASQGIGIGGRVGTLGVGAEAAVGLGERFVLRGGIGFTPYEPSLTLSDLDLTLMLPTWYNVGIDAYLNGALRLGGGVLLKSREPRVEGVFTTNQQIGASTYTPQEIGTLIGVMDSRDQVPYVLIGFGKHTAPVVGLFVDFGVAFLGEPDLRLSTEGGSLNSHSGTFRTELDREEAEFEDDAGPYLELWPIFNLGLRIGIP